MPDDKKAVAFQSIRPAACKCTDKEVCRHCKGKRRAVSWEEAVRENNLKFIREKGGEK